MTPFEDLKDMKMMLIDDDEWIRDSLRIFFETEGCDLSAFDTAEEALEELKTQPYDLIIVDYKLPAMNGLQFLARAGEACPGAINILMAGPLTDSLMAEAKKLPIKGVVEKPFTCETLLASLAFIMHQRSAVL